jgi:hypothetical protein
LSDVEDCGAREAFQAGRTCFDAFHLNCFVEVAPRLGLGSSHALLASTSTRNEDIARFVVDAQVRGFARSPSFRSVKEALQWRRRSRLRRPTANRRQQSRPKGQQGSPFSAFLATRVSGRRWQVLVIERQEDVPGVRKSQDASHWQPCAGPWSPSTSWTSSRLVSKEKPLHPLDGPEFSGRGFPSTDPAFANQEIGVAFSACSTGSGGPRRLDVNEPRGGLQNVRVVMEEAKARHVIHQRAGISISFQIPAGFPGLPPPSSFIPGPLFFLSHHALLWVFSSFCFLMPLF